MKAVPPPPPTAVTQAPCFGPLLLDWGGGHLEAMGPACLQALPCEGECLRARSADTLVCSVLRGRNKV